jgi:hypothetical protein
MNPQADPDDADLTLRAQLRALTATQPDADAIERLQRHALDQWRAQVATPLLPARRHGPVLTAARDHRRWWIGSAGLALGLVLLVGLWLQRPATDPTLDDLLRPDVLSQMAAGEM